MYTIFSFRMEVHHDILHLQLTLSGRRYNIKYAIFLGYIGATFKKNEKTAKKEKKIGVGSVMNSLYVYFLIITSLIFEL